MRLVHDASLMNGVLLGVPFANAVVGATCELHKEHKPPYTYCERHHIIPQAWQFTWLPENFDLHKGPVTDAADAAFPFWGVSPDHTGFMLWDARTANICRTGHGNVHFYLVRLMQHMSDGAILADAGMRVLKEFGHVNRNDLGTAQGAISRFKQAGGDLATLWAAKQWGAI